MSIETRVKKYAQLFSDWIICEPAIGRGSHTGEAESTLVYKLIRNGHAVQEESALKIVNIISKEGVYDYSTDAEKRRYDEECQDKCRAAEREVQLMYELRGASNVVSYLDYKVASWQDTQRYGCDLLIRMDLFDGSLQDEIASGKFCSEQEIVRVGLDMCTALKECHRHKIIHRDIKPHNIFIMARASEKEYLLGDFGISKILENRDYAVTATGTQEYMAPEQFIMLGNSQYDSRVDIYSLGLVLYQLANGNRLPFSTPTGYVDQDAIRRRISGETLPMPNTISPQLAQVILKACAYRAEDRYQSAEEFFGALYDIQRGVPLQDTAQIGVAIQVDPFLTMPADAFEQMNYDRNPLGTPMQSQGMRPVAQEELISQEKTSSGIIAVLCGILLIMILVIFVALAVLFWPDSESGKEESHRESVVSSRDEELQGEDFDEEDQEEYEVQEYQDDTEVTEGTEETEETEEEQEGEEDAPAGTEGGGFIFPYSDRLLLMRSDLETLNADTARIARNEIYARHGRMFNDEELQAYFDAQAWYIPIYLPEEFEESMLNEIEKKNAEMIAAYEDEMGFV